MHMSSRVCLVMTVALAWISTANGGSLNLQKRESSQSHIAVQDFTPKTQVTPASTWSGSVIEEFSFAIPDFKMDHQTEINNLNIKVRYTYVFNIGDKDYPDFRLLASDVKEFLRNYSNKTDYWEVLNKKLTLMLVRKYAALSSLTSEIVVSPSQLVPYSRCSIVTRKRPRVKGTGKQDRR